MKYFYYWTLPFIGSVMGGGFYIYNLSQRVSIAQETIRQVSLKCDKVEKARYLQASAAPRETNSWTSIQNELKNGVAQVMSDINEFNWLEPFRTPTQQKGRGTGFFINEEGDFITNYHVIDQAYSIKIRLPFLGQEQFEMTVIGVSPERDIALLKLKDEDKERLKNKLGGTIPYLPLGDSDIITRAQDVMALGYPLGQENLKSTIGNVSGREKVIATYFIQITAPLNGGNSGGPCLSMHGEVIGVNTAGILAAQNVGYIIPINEVKSALKDLYKVKLLRKPVLGCIFTSATEDVVHYLGNPGEGGWYIAHVFPNSLLEKAGVKEGDMLYEVNGHSVDRHGDISVSWSDGKVSLLDLINRFVVGDNVHLVVYRSGERKDITFTIQPRYLLPMRKMYPEFEQIDYEVIAGMCVMQFMLNHVVLLLAQAPQLAPFLAHYVRPEYQSEKTLIITSIFPDSPAQSTEVMYVGMMLDEVNGQKVSTLDEFRAAVRLSKARGFLTIKAKDNPRFAVMSLEKILKEEDFLVSRYLYKRSSLIKDLTNDGGVRSMVDPFHLSKYLTWEQKE